MATNFLPYGYGYEPGEELDPELAALYGGVPMASFPPDVYQQVPDEAPGPPPGSPLEVQPGVPPPPQTPPFAPPPQQSFGQRLKGAIPRMFNGAIDAMATPNVAGGGAVDMARALQAAQGGAQQRDILSYNMARQRERDDLDRQQRQAQAELYRKHGEYYDRMGQAKVAAPKTDIEADLYRDWQAETDPAVKQQKWDRFQQFKHGVASPAKPPERYEVSKEAADKIGLMADQEGKFWVPASWFPAQVRAENPKPEQPETKTVGNQLYERQTDGSWKKVAEAPRAEPAPQGHLIPLTDQYGRIVKFYNNKTGEVTDPPVEDLRKGGVPAGEMEKRSTLTVMTEDIKTIRGLLMDPKVSEVIGPISGRVADLKRNTIGGVGDGVNDLFRLSDNLADQLLRARSGAQINEAEFARLRKLVPNARGPLDKFKTDLDTFESELNRLLQYRTGGHPAAGGPPATTSAPQTAPIVQRSKRTGATRYSTDGGNTWQNGQPPRQ
jgi:hypothetical protein